MSGSPKTPRPTRAPRPPRPPRVAAVAPPVEEEEEIGFVAEFIDLDVLAESESDDAELDIGFTAEDLIDERGVPLIAIVGRPNVGKSRLFNRMTGTRFAIVEDMPGVTRDRNYGDGEWEGRRYQVVDTGGFEPESQDVILRQMREQARLAIEEAEIILFIMDAQAGLLPADVEIADILRRQNKPVFYVVNKVDGPKQEATLGEFYSLGVDRIYGVSAEHGRDYDVLLDDVLPYLPKVPVARDPEQVLRIAVLGRPNAGKSTLINRVLGQERLLTSDIPGTTRDSINTYVEREGQRYLFIDTAGIRRRRAIVEQVEKYSVVQAFKAIDRADVVLYLIDAGIGPSQQDQRICGLIEEKGKGLVLVLNKWDLAKTDPKSVERYITTLREELRFVAWAPVVTISARTGKRVHRLFEIVAKAKEQYVRRISTSELNRFLEITTRRNPPPSRGAQRLKIYFATQVSTAPPTFMFVVNRKDLVPVAYERYLRNSLREAFGFEGAPVKYFFRERSQKGADDDPNEES